MEPGQNAIILLSDGFLARHNGTLREATATCYNRLMVIFRDHFISRKEEIRKSLDKKETTGIDEKELTFDITVSDLGLNKSHAERVGEYLQEIHDYPVYIPKYILGKKTYTRLHLITSLTPIPYEGKGKRIWRIVFDRHLALHVFPEKEFGKCDLSIREEIQKRNMVSALFYEHGCQSQFNKPGRDGYYFDLTEQELRTKLRFDMLEEDGTTSVIKNVRWDHLVYRYINPALNVLEEFFNNGMIAFWLSKQPLGTYARNNDTVGSPKKGKRGFRFTIMRESRNTTEVRELDNNDVQQTLTNEVRVEIYNYTKTLDSILHDGGFRQHKRYADLVEKQLLEKFIVDPAILDKARKKVDEKRDCCLRDNKDPRDLSNILRKALWKDFGLGEDYSRNDSTEDSVKDGNWPEDREAQMEIMTSNHSRIVEYLQVHSFSEADKDMCLVGFRTAINNHVQTMTSEEALWKYFNNWLGWYRRKLNNKNNGTEGNTDDDSPGKAAFISKHGGR